MTDDTFKIINANKLYFYGIPPVIQQHVRFQITEEIVASFVLLTLQDPDVCMNCGDKNTPLWRKGWNMSDREHTRPIKLCNKCGLKCSKQQYCKNCGYIYDCRDKHSRCANCRIKR